MKAIRILIAVALCMLAFAAGARTLSADDIISGAAAKFAAAPSVEAQFTIRDSGNPVQGSIIIAGGKFTITTPVLEVWYDGTTQWTLLRSSSEVNVTEPTADELMESNPFAILRNYSSRYKARRLPDSQGCKRVELTPLHPSDTEIAKAIISIGSNGWPTGCDVTLNDGRTISCSIDHIGVAAAKPASVFRFDSSRNPDIEIIDLR